MTDGRYVAYYRVSTAKQGRSGLGLDAQREAVRGFLEGRRTWRPSSDGSNWSLLAEHTEVESGKRDDRPELAIALRTCRLTGASLIIAKLDRLSRDAAFLLNLEKSGVEFVAADMPNANRLTVRLMAVIAQEEREMISARTKAALTVARARGTRLGGWRGTLKSGQPNEYTVDHTIGTKALQARADAFAATVGPLVREMRDAGDSLRQIAAALTEQGIRTPRGGAWTADAVNRVLLRAPAPPCDSQEARTRLLGCHR